MPVSESTSSQPTADSQSIVICAMHRSTDSWVTTFSLLTQPSHSWGHFVPELRTVLSQLPGFPVQKLTAAQDSIVDKVSQTAMSSRPVLPTCTLHSHTCRAYVMAVTLTFSRYHWRHLAHILYSLACPQQA